MQNVAAGQFKLFALYFIYFIYFDYFHLLFALRLTRKHSAYLPALVYGYGCGGVCAANYSFVRSEY